MVRLCTKSGQIFLQLFQRFFIYMGKDILEDTAVHIDSSTLFDPSRFCQQAEIAFFIGQQRYVKGTTSKVVKQDLLTVF